jgi:hypothetical protein
MATRYRRAATTSLGLVKSLVRCLAVIIVAVALPLTYAGAASADVPERWSNPDDVSFLHALLVLGGIPLAVIVFLALAVYLPSVVRGESVAPAGARADDEWFGGRRDADKALESRKPDADTTEETGGASGSW